MIVITDYNADDRIGIRVIGMVSDRDKNTHIMPSMLVRRAMLEEYLEYCAEQGVLDKVNMKTLEGMFFYELSID